MTEERTEIGFIESCDVPSVYSNKQSYYEVLCYINYKLNELIDVYNQLEFDYKKYVDSQLQDVKDYADEEDQKHSESDRLYTDEKSDNAIRESKLYTDNLKDSVNKKLSEISDLISEMQTSIDTLESNLKVEETERKREDTNLDLKIISTQTNIDILISSLRKELTAVDDFLLTTINRNVDELKQWVKTYYIATYTVQNPWRGYDTDLQSCVNDIFSVYAPLSMSCSQLDNIIPEVTYIEAENLSCNDFDFNGLRVKQYLSDAYMHSPVSGKYMKLQDVISEIMTQVVVSVSIGATNSGNRGFSMGYSSNVINVVDTSTLSASDISAIDERLSLMQPYTTMSMLDIYPYLVLDGKNPFTSTEDTLRFESVYN